jgi:hypothetical protein
VAIPITKVQPDGRHAKLAAAKNRWRKPNIVGVNSIHGKKTAIKYGMTTKEFIKIIM